MKTTRELQTGSVGQVEVAGKFARLDWGYAFNSDHDLGTDLWLMPRAPSLQDLAMIVGAQVKGGPSWFKEPAIDKSSGEVVGWWFRDSHNHFNYWLSHQAAHLIVLHDTEADVSYWVQVNVDTVTFLKKRAKILVPCTQRVDEANAAALVDVALSKVAGSTWQGSALLGTGHLSGTDVYRYAALLPRLVAPHPNDTTRGSLTAAQAMASVVLGRQARQRRAGESAALPDLDAVDGTSAWEWQLVAGLARFIETGEPDKLCAPVIAAEEPHQRAVSSVLLAAAQIEDGDPQAAVDVLAELLTNDDLGTVDSGWARVQYARALRDLGKVDEARDVVLGLVNFANEGPGDLSAAAIGGAAANMVFALSDWGSHDIATTITASDTHAAWWRQQVTSWGLAHQAEEGFRKWADDTSAVFGAGERAYRHLRAASLIASFLGDHDAWRASIGRLARYVLTNPDHKNDASALGMAIDALRTSGADKDLKAAAAHLVANGPLSVVQLAVAECAANSPTTTSIRADLALLTVGGDLLSTQDAERVADWAIATCEDDAEFHRRFHPWFQVERSMLEVLGSVVPALNSVMQEKLADWLLKLPAQGDQIVAHELARIARNLPTFLWTEERSSRAATRADGDNWELTYALLGVSQGSLPAVRERLATEAADGQWPAMASIGDITELGPDIAGAIAMHLEQRLKSRIDAAHSGGFANGANPGVDLVTLNAWHPAQARWEQVYQLLRTVDYSPYLGGVLGELTRLVRELPDSALSILEPIAHHLTTREPSLMDRYEGADARPAAKELLAAIRGRQSGTPELELIGQLAVSDSEARSRAAWLCEEPHTEATLGMLTVLAGDSDSAVRAAVAATATRRAAKGDEPAARIAESLARDQGLSVPLTIASVLAREGPVALQDRFEQFGQHPSARVRLRYAQTQPMS